MTDSSPQDGLNKSLAGPLRQLAGEYAEAARASQEIAAALEELADHAASGGVPGGRLRPQRGAGQAPRPQSRQRDAVEDLRSRISRLPLVDSAVFEDGPAGTTLVVDLRRQESPTVVCAICGRTLADGSSEVSHGLCEACAAKMTGGLRSEA